MEKEAKWKRFKIAAVVNDDNMIRSLAQEMDIDFRTLTGLAERFRRNEIRKNEGMRLLEKSLYTVRFCALLYENGKSDIVPASMFFNDEFLEKTGADYLPDRIFENNLSITNIRISDRIRFIGNSAFSGCVNLKEVTFPKELEEIGEYAFLTCGMESINLPNSVTRVRRSAFAGCVNLKSVNIPHGLSFLEDRSFACCYALEKVTCDTTTKKLAIKEGAFESCRNLKTMNWLIATDLEKEAFAFCKNIESITIASKSIEGKCFYGCSKLSSVTVRDELTTYISEDAFDMCLSLDSVNYKYFESNVKKSSDLCRLIYVAKNRSAPESPLSRLLEKAVKKYETKNLCSGM